ncbi:MAG: isocitrate/isopropylmalate dehydrogenase family protein [Haloarculaceae archaeon]
MAHHIAVVPGDGIGPEVVDATVPLVERVAERHGIELSLTRYGWGSERYLEEGSLLPDDAFDRLRDHDAVLHGAMGDPRVPDEVTSISGPIAIRRALDLYVNLRPAYLFEGAPTPLSGYDAGEIDVEWYRENTEGEYGDIGGQLTRGGETDLAVETSVYTRKGVERIARAAFEAALDRDRHVTNVTKSNALRYGPTFWDDVVEEVAEDYPAIELEHLFVDAASMALVRRPEEFDVVVSSNLFGDILTDLTAAITGGLGMTPSANLNPELEVPGMFEPVHGSAPDIAGEGIANPIASVLTEALMFEDLGEDGAAADLRAAVVDHFADPDSPRTPDIGGEAGTEDVVDSLDRRL